MPQKSGLGTWSKICAAQKPEAALLLFKVLIWHHAQ